MYIKDHFPSNYFNGQDFQKFWTSIDNEVAFGTIVDILFFGQSIGFGSILYTGWSEY
jgi:hypothetical protein